MTEKKKLLYIVRYPIYEDFNLRGKFDGQLAAFRKLNLDVYHLVFDKEYFYLVHEGEKEAIGRAASHMPMYFHTRVYYDMHMAALKAMEKLRFDFIYWRDAPIWRSSCTVGRTAHKAGTKIIYEIPTYCKGGETAMSIPRRIFSLYANLWKQELMRYPDAFIFTGDADFDTFYGKPAINIDNGVNVDAMPLRSPRENTDAVHILALASMSYWHGYDRLIKSLRQYTGGQRVMIHMVGGNDGGMLPEWKKLVSDLELEDRVIFHGKLYGDDLTTMFNLCDIGINSLGLYRKNMDATSELKIREYAARGLPFVCSVEDPAFAFATEEFWIRVPNDDTIPDMNQIVNFALKMRTDKAHTRKLRDYAEKYMTWEGQYASVFQMFEEEQ
ncbi:MAG: glycosyltransferase [Oscillospiraceae bacterium]|nr:glycosyltransferase [Oscillospiraceae bacterium]